MAEDADIRLFPVQPDLNRCGKLFPFIQNMAEADCDSCTTNKELPRKTASLIAVDITGYSHDRCNLLQLPDDGSVSDVSRMQNLGHPGKVFFNGRVEQTVSIGNDADADRA